MSLPVVKPPPGGLTGTGETFVGSFPVGVDQYMVDSLENVAPGAFAMQVGMGWRGANGLPGVTFQSQHDQTVVYASGESGSLAIAVNDYALAFTGRLPGSALLLPDQIGHVYSSISPSFIAMAAVWDMDPVSEMARRTITEMFLVELSAVASPAWSGTTLDLAGGFRSLAPTKAETAKMLAAAKARLDAYDREVAGQHEVVGAQLALHDRVTAHHQSDIAYARARGSR